MQLQRRRGGKVFIVEATGQDVAALERQRERWPDSFVQWEGMGLPYLDEAGQIHRGEPAFALWRPRDAAPTPDPAEAPAGPNKRRPSPRSLPRTVKHKNLTRIEQGPKQRPGYLVRVTWQRQTKAKYFADAVYGDRLGSLAAALEWRDKTERELGKPHTQLNVVGAASSNTGLVGITRTTQRGIPVFQVTWYENGRQRRRIFNIERLGERQALRAAQAARAKAEAARLR